ncbi:MAG: DUF4442 domain-containing protein [Ignavibacteria bacterium]
MGLLAKLRFPPGVMRAGINLWPPFVGAGIHVLEIAPDYRHITVRLRRGWLNRNYFGTQFGGSLFSMTDPFYAIMLLHNLPRGYRVWDRAARIEFKTPGRTHVYARFELTDAMLADVLAATADGAKYEPIWPVDVVDRDGAVVATVEKTLYIRRAPPSDKLPPP